MNVDSFFSLELLRTFAGMAAAISIVMAILSTLFTTWMALPTVRNAVGVVLSIAMVMVVSVSTDTSTGNIILAFLNGFVLSAAVLKVAAPIQNRIEATKSK